MHKKKGLLNSVRRNKIKRQVRYILANIEKSKHTVGYYLVILRPNCACITYKELKNQLEFALYKIRERLKNENIK